ncbi:hypothetical protein ACF09C_20030 [Streptomyces sp. NPDC014870]|uniref:hypothetical protein n=1 Tax=Streptomyces sp. NPDC014870 TaxID=3364925 RepID=UPI0036FD1C9D
MHADVHLLLHDLRAAELHDTATESGKHTLPGTPMRTRLGWTLVELGLRLAVPGVRPVTVRPAATVAA